MSLRLILMNLFFRAVAKPRLRKTTDHVQARRDFALSARLFLARGRGMRRTFLEVEPQILQLAPPDGGNGRVILYFHGGGFIVGSPQTHQGVAARLAELTGCLAWLPDYRLAPEHPFPAAWEDADGAWAALMDTGIAPGDVVLAGESAGGGLALALLARLCAAGTPPAGAVVFSPWTDLTGQSETLQTNRARDPLLPAEGFGRLVEHVLAGHRADDPRASPMFAHYPACPPVLFQVGQTEIMRDDTLVLAARLKAQGADVTVSVWPDVPHAWQLMVGRLPEADRAVQSAAAFVRNLLFP